MLLPIIAFVAALILIAIGFIGIFVPFLPGVFLAWVGLATYALVTGFEQISGTVILIFLFISIGTIFLDIIAPAIGAKRYHASRYGILGSSLGLLAALPFLGPVGIIVGPIAGAFVGELISGKEPEKAGRAAFGAFLGFLAGTLVKVIVVFVMTGFLIVSLF